MLSGVVNLSWEYVIHGLERLWVQKMLTLYAFPIFNATMPSHWLNSKHLEGSRENMKIVYIGDLTQF